MIIILKRLNIFLFLLILLFSVLTFSMYYKTEDIKGIETFASKDGNKIILLDAGHGGVDGGASGKSGVLEKDLNLKIAKKLEQILISNGFLAVMTRIDDYSIHDSDDKTIRSKKRSDLQNRLELVAKANAQVLVSIHMNKFEIEKYKGAQVFYSPNNEDSKKLGEFIQNRLKEKVDNSNERLAKKAGKNIFVLKNVKIPAVIVECGFLSNNEEEVKLQNDDYQQKIALAIYEGIIDFFNTRNPTQFSGKR